MSVPDFSKIPLRGDAAASASRRVGGRRRRCRRRALGDAGGHRRRRALLGSRRRRPRLPRDVPRAGPVPARPVPDDVHEPAVDDPPVRRVLHGRGVQRLLPAQPRRRPEGPLRRVRPGDAPRLRQRPPAGAGRRRHGRRGHRLDPRHAPAVRPHPARRDERVDDDERRRAPGARALRRRRRGAGREAGAAGGHDPERRAQGVHGPEHVHLPAGAVDADHLRHLQLHVAGDAEVQLDLDLRLPHAGGRGDRRPRARVHARRRRRVHPRRPRRRADDRRLRAAPVVLLGHRHELLHGGGQDARRPPPVGEARQAVRAGERQVAVAAHALPDVGLVADRAGRLQQRRANVRRGDGGDAGPHPVAAHQRPRRGARRCRPTSRPASPATPSCSCNRSPARPASSTPGAAATTSSASPTTSPPAPGRTSRRSRRPAA